MSAFANIINKGKKKESKRGSEKCKRGPFYNILKQKWHPGLDTIDGKHIKNPNEVVRKARDKKSDQKRIEGAYFENQALDLDVPEKHFNPYEVSRKTFVQQGLQCFENQAFDLSTSRCDVASDNDNINLDSINTSASGQSIELENYFFLSSRRNFNNIFHESSKSDPKLSKISERATAVDESRLDITGKLDLYKLELENNMNEAKMIKYFGNSNKITPLGECRVKTGKEELSKDKLTNASITKNDFAVYSNYNAKITITSLEEDLQVRQETVNDLSRGKSATTFNKENFFNAKTYIRKRCPK